MEPTAYYNIAQLGRSTYAVIGHYLPRLTTVVLFWGDFHECADVLRRLKVSA